MTHEKPLVREPDDATTDARAEAGPQSTKHSASLAKRDDGRSRGRTRYTTRIARLTLRALDWAGQRLAGPTHELTRLPPQERLERTALGGARIFIVFIACIVVLYTPIDFLFLSGSVLVLNLMSRTAFVGVLLLLLWASYYREELSGERLGVLCLSGITFAILGDAGLSGLENHPFVFGPMVFLLGLAEFVPMKPSKYLWTAFVVALTPPAAILLNIVSMDSFTLALNIAFTGTVAIVGGIAVQQRRHTLLLQFRSEQELRENALALSDAVEALKLTQEQLVTSERMAMLGRLTAGIAHEINTPLAANLNSLHELENLVGELQQSLGHPDVTEDDMREIAVEAHQALELCIRASKRAATFIRELKQETRHLGREEERVFDVLEEIAGVLTLLRHQTKRSRSPIEIEGPSGLTVRGDPGRFAQVITNLVTNALDATSALEQQQAIVIRVADDGTALQLSVIDHGTGIPKHLEDQVFEPMVTSKPIGQGTGLGLAITRDIVVGSFGGTIYHEHTPGGGATFRLTLPKHKLDTQSLRRAGTPSAGSPFVHLGDSSGYEDEAT